jgi:hypothetical protein
MKLETNRPSLIKGKAETACGGFNQSLRRFPQQKSPAIVQFQLGISERIWGFGLLMGADADMGGVPHV